MDDSTVLNNDCLIRQNMLIGTEATVLLQKSAVVIFGLGGVGSYAAEATARAGVGRICLVDGDVVAKSNLNRQLVALSSTVGKSKARVMSERIADISKEIRTETMEFFYTEETADRIDLAEFDYIIDAIDMVSAKLLLIERANRQGVPIISAMGTGKQTGSHCLYNGGYLRNVGLPVVQGDEEGTAEEGHRAAESSLFSRGAHKPPGRRGSCGRKAADAGKCVVCAAGCRHDSCGRGHQGFGTDSAAGQLRNI